MSRFFFVFAVPLAAALSNLPTHYQSLPPDSKRDLLWIQIENTVYNVSNLPINETKPPETLKLLKPDYLQPSFLHVPDEMPAGRKKLMNALGTTAKCRLDIFPNSSFSGIFKTGGLGLVRLSERIRDPNHVMPMMAIKIFINGRPSQNLFVSYSNDGQGKDQRFFQNNMSNVIAPATEASLVSLADQFKNATKLLPGSDLDRPYATTNMPLVEPSSVSSNGQDADTIVAPFQIDFVPQLKFKWAVNDTEDYRSKIARMVPPGATLYSLFARSTPSETGWTPLGKVITESWFIASDYGDKTLFFQHPVRQWTDGKKGTEQHGGSE